MNAAGFLVVLDVDQDEERAAATLSALRLIKGVATVEPIPAAPEQGIGWARCDQYWRKRLVDLLAQDPSTAGTQC